MANKLYEESSIINIANAIRSVNGSSDTYKVSQMADAIENISTGLDWSELNYNTSDTYKGTPIEVVNAFNYAKSIMNTYEVTSTYINDKNLFFFPNIDLQSRYNCQNMFDKSNLLHCPPLTLGSMASGAGNITTNYMFRQTFIEDIELSSVNNNALTIYLTNTFYDCSRLKTAKFNANIELSEGAFNGCSTLDTLSFEKTLSAGQLRYVFRGCSSLVSLPSIVTSGITLATEMCKGCTILENVPIYDFSSVTNMQNAFQNCPNLSDTSLDNILVMSINATAFTGTKSLAYWGIANTYDSRIVNLPHYQDFIDAGWTIR